MDSVVARAMGVVDESKAFMRKISSWSFVVRRKVYDIAANMCTTIPVVVDIGSGRMQSYSVMSSLPLTFLLCDPELDLGSLSHSDVCYNITGLDDSSIVSAIRGCVRSRIKYLVYRNTLENLLSRDKVFWFLRDKSIPLCYSFSLSHTYEHFRDLASRGLPQVGCCYLYDKADARGVLFDDYSVSMRLSTDDHCRGVVAMPPDPFYEECALRSADLGPNALVDSVVDHISDIAMAEMRVRDVFRHVYIATSS